MLELVSLRYAKVQTDLKKNTKPRAKTTTVQKGAYIWKFEIPKFLAPYIYFLLKGPLLNINKPVQTVKCPIFGVTDSRTCSILTFSAMLATACQYKINFVTKLDIFRAETSLVQMWPFDLISLIIIHCVDMNSEQKCSIRNIFNPLHIVLHHIHNA